MVMQGRVLFLAMNIKALLISLRAGTCLTSVKKQDVVLYHDLGIVLDD